MVAFVAAMREAWNTGDFETYMQYHENRPETLLIFDQNVYEGWDAVRALYKNIFDTGARKGEVSFSNERVFSLSENTATLTANWCLQSLEGRQIGGIFTLALRRNAEGWRIVVDHSATIPQEQKVEVGLK